MNGAVGHDFQSEGGRIRKTRETQFVGRKAGDAQPRDAQRMPVQLNGATVVTQSDQRADAG